MSKRFKYEVTEGVIAGIIMGSQSDWSTMRKAAETLEALQVPFEVHIVSAHRTPERMDTYATLAKQKGLQVIIAGAGGAAHLPGMVSSKTRLPVMGVPIKSSALSGVDSVWSILQMPAGIPTATFSIGDAGAVNAALGSVRILALHDKELDIRYEQYIETMVENVLDIPID